MLLNDFFETNGWFALYNITLGGYICPEKSEEDVGPLSGAQIFTTRLDAERFMKLLSRTYDYVVMTV